jgi:hypothetical protein
MILNLTDEQGKVHFEFLFVGFVLGGSLQDKKGMPLLRKEVALFMKFEEISEPKPCGKKLPNGELERILTGSQIEITLDEFDMLYNYLSAVAWQTGTPAKLAVETIDWLRSHGNS